jgi:hypothetical protein
MGDFHGLRTGCIENRHARVEYLLDAGPRLVRLSVGGGENLLAEAPEVCWPTAAGVFHLRGGHRVWASPEVSGVTDEPDDRPITVEELANGAVRLLGQPGPRSNLQPELIVRLDDECPRVVVRNRLINHGVEPAHVAAWGITMLRQGGLAVLPQPRGTLPGRELQPNRLLALWPYASWQDGRLRVTDAAGFVRSVPGEPFKVGQWNPDGWLAYVLGQTVFLKRFYADHGGLYADLGCNAEVYANQAYIELESLGPLLELQPGESVAHTEIWDMLNLPQRPDLDTLAGCVAVFSEILRVKDGLDERAIPA